MANSRHQLSLACVMFICMSVCRGHMSSRYSDPNAPRDHSEGNRDILVMGGNGFIGSHTVERLTSRGYNVTSLHRNNTYWLWHSAHHSRVLPCDRNYDLTNCDSLAQLEFRPFLAVIDLSGYVDLAVMQSIQLLMGRFQYYVYLSTDSVYDVSDKRHSGKSRESDGAFPTDAALRNRLRVGRRYAEAKLTAEFVVDLLAAEHNGANYDYTIVRIPDTFGSRDTSYRFWYYMRAVDSGSVRLPDAGRETRMSLAYVDDVANFLVGLVDRYRRLARPVGTVKEVFNFAYQETWTASEFVSQLAVAMELSEAPKIEYTDAASQLYPTVTSGPISVEKAAEACGDWLPATPLLDALRSSVAFYRDVENRPAEFVNETARFKELLAEWNGGTSDDSGR